MIYHCSIALWFHGWNKFLRSKNHNNNVTMKQYSNSGFATLGRRRKQFQGPQNISKYDAQKK